MEVIIENRKIEDFHGHDPCQFSELVSRLRLPVAVVFPAEVSLPNKKRCCTA